MRAEPRAEHDEASFEYIIACFARLLEKATEAGEPTQGSGGVIWGKKEELKKNSKQAPKPKPKHNAAKGK